MVAGELFNEIKQSHPVWDEWIEIPRALMLTLFQKGSHPVWDEWIEIG